MTIDINQHTFRPPQAQAVVQNRCDSTAAEQLEDSKAQETAASMEPSNGGGGLDDRTFEDYDPAVECSHAADAATVTISLPGFKKEELRVLVDNHGYLQMRGQRPAAMGGTGWIRFRKNLKLPDGCDIEGIRSKFANETLTVTLPKMSRPSPPDGSALPDPAPSMTDEDEDEEGEEETVGEKEKVSGRRPIRWLLATVAAVLFVGITGYVVWRKLRSGCAAGDHGPGELVGAGRSYVNEM